MYERYQPYQMDSQNLLILQPLFNLPICGEVKELFDKLDNDIKSMIQKSIEQKNALKIKKNEIDTELSNYDHLMFLNETNYNKNEDQNISDVSKTLTHLQYLTHKTIREINMEIVSLKYDIEVMEHDLGLYKKNRMNNEHDVDNIYIEFPSDDNNV